MGARYYDPVLGRFLAVDPVNVRPDDIHSFNRYAYGNNNPYKFVDRDGRSPALVAEAVPLLLIGGIYYTLQTPEKQREMVRSLQRVFDSVSRADAAPQGNEADTGLPTDLVGEQDKKSGARGDRHNSGPLDPSNGGTGDAQKDFDKLTGGKNGPAPADKKFPPGTQVGKNNVAIRPGQGNDGPRIDVPANGRKPHETLHYPR
jgi:uncharacterized protein RhaS with RHS repeats